MFVSAAALALTLVANTVTAADYTAGASTTPSANAITVPNPQPNVSVAPDGTNQTSAQLGELELKAQFKLLSDLAQAHRQRAEAAAKSDQAQKAKWEADLAEEFGARGSNTLAQIDRLAALPQSLPTGSPETADTLSQAESEYLAKIQERLQAVQQDITAAMDEATGYALQAATNANTVVYGENSPSTLMQESARSLKRLRAEQAELELKTSQFWALRAMLRSTKSIPAR